MTLRFGDELAWSQLAPLRISAPTVAEGAYLGAHRSRRRGSGIEFGGHRHYVPGDDLRWLDRHASMRHGRLLVREFEMETDRQLNLLIDASASMGFASRPNLPAKLRFASLLAAALAYIATKRGDPVSLHWLGGIGAQALPERSGKEGFERLADALESAGAGQDLSEAITGFDHALARLARRATRGSLVVLLTDLIDLPDAALEHFITLGTERRTLITLQILDPMEASFELTRGARFTALEGSFEVEAEPDAVREHYLASLRALQSRWQQRLTALGGHFVTAQTTDNPVDVVRKTLALLGVLQP